MVDRQVDPQIDNKQIDREAEPSEGKRNKCRQFKEVIYYRKVSTKQQKDRRKEGKKMEWTSVGSGKADRKKV